MVNIEKEREAFEQFYASKGWRDDHLDRYADGDYKDGFVRDLFACYLAGLSTPSQPSQPASVPQAKCPTCKDTRKVMVEDYDQGEQWGACPDCPAPASVQTMGEPVAYRWRWPNVSKNWQHGAVSTLWVEARGSEANTFEYEPLYTSAPTLAEGMVVVSREVVEYLTGIGPLEGVHFGDDHPTERGKFWWRKYLNPEGYVYDKDTRTLRLKAALSAPGGKV